MQAYMRRFARAATTAVGAMTSSATTGAIASSCCDTLPTTMQLYTSVVLRPGPSRAAARTRIQCKGFFVFFKEAREAL